MKKGLRWLDQNLEECLMVFLLAAMTVIMGIQVFSRYALGMSLTWSEELTRYLFIWAGFLSVSYCTKKCISIKIEQFVALFPKRGKALFKVVNHTLELILLFYLIPCAWKYFHTAIASGQDEPGPGTSYVCGAGGAAFGVPSCRCPGAAEMDRGVPGCAGKGVDHADCYCISCIYSLSGHCDPGFHFPFGGIRPAGDTGFFLCGKRDVCRPLHAGRTGQLSAAGGTDVRAVGDPYGKRRDFGEIISCICVFHGEADGWDALRGDRYLSVLRGYFRFRSSHGGGGGKYDDPDPDPDPYGL